MLPTHDIRALLRVSPEVIKNDAKKYYDYIRHSIHGFTVNAVVEVCTFRPLRLKDHLSADQQFELIKESSKFYRLLLPKNKENFHAWIKAFDKSEAKATQKQEARLIFSVVKLLNQSPLDADELEAIIKASDLVDQTLKTYATKPPYKEDQIELTQKLIALCRADKPVDFAARIHEIRPLLTSDGLRRLCELHADVVNPEFLEEQIKTPPDQDLFATEIVMSPLLTKILGRERASSILKKVAPDKVQTVMVKFLSSPEVVATTSAPVKEIKQSPQTVELKESPALPSPSYNLVQDPRLMHIAAHYQRLHNFFAEEKAEQWHAVLQDSAFESFSQSFKEAKENFNIDKCLRLLDWAKNLFKDPKTGALPEPIAQKCSDLYKDLSSFWIDPDLQARLEKEDIQKIVRSYLQYCPPPTSDLEHEAVVNFLVRNSESCPEDDLVRLMAKSKENGRYGINIYDIFSHKQLASRINVQSALDVFSTVLDNNGRYEMKGTIHKYLLDQLSSPTTSDLTPFVNFYTMPTAENTFYSNLPFYDQLAFLTQCLLKSRQSPLTNEWLKDFFQNQSAQIKAELLQFHPLFFEHFTLKNALETFTNEDVLAAFVGKDRYDPMIFSRCHHFIYYCMLQKDSDQHIDQISRAIQLACKKLDKTESEFLFLCLVSDTNDKTFEPIKLMMRTSKPATEAVLTYLHRDIDELPHHSANLLTDMFSGENPRTIFPYVSVNDVVSLFNNSEVRSRLNLTVKMNILKFYFEQRDKKTPKIDPHSCQEFLITSFSQPVALSTGSLETKQAVLESKRAPQASTTTYNPKEDPLIKQIVADYQLLRAKMDETKLDREQNAQWKQILRNSAYVAFEKVFEGYKNNLEIDKCFQLLNWASDYEFFKDLNGKSDFINHNVMSLATQSLRSAINTQWRKTLFEDLPQSKNPINEIENLLMNVVYRLRNEIDQHIVTKFKVGLSDKQEDMKLVNKLLDELKTIKKLPTEDGQQEAALKAFVEHLQRDKSQAKTPKVQGELGVCAEEFNRRVLKQPEAPSQTQAHS